MGFFVYKCSVIFYNLPYRRESSGDELVSEIIIKSASRVKLHGEVFTPKLTVDLMLDQPEITAKINNLSATFLLNSVKL